MLYQAVLALRGRCTIVIIAHRAEDLAACDAIALLEDGRLAQHGTPSALLAEAGPFARLAKELGLGVLDRVCAAANAPR
jgi:ATP-binding cassette subfamily B protein